MDYSALAAELLSFRTALHHLPAIRGLDEMSGGEYFVLHFLLRHGGTAGPSELSRSLYASSARIAALLKHLEAKAGSSARRMPPMCAVWTSSSRRPALHASGAAERGAG